MKIGILRILSFSLFFLLFCTSCKQELQKRDANLIAELGPHQLWSDEFESLFSSKNPTERDKKEKINQWIIDKLIIAEGKLYLGDNNEIEELVNDYRSSLVKNKFQELYTSSRVNKNVTEQELVSYYEANKDKFVHNNRYLKTQIAKIPVELDVSDKFNGMWKDEDFDSMNIFCKENNLICLLNPDTLYSENHIKVLLPKSIHKGLSKGKNLRQISGEYEYFVKTIDRYDNNSENALEIHRENILQSILFARKKQVLINLRDSLFNLAIEKNRIKIYEVD